MVDDVVGKNPGTSRQLNGVYQHDYLTIARKTGGSIHTMEDDLESLQEIEKGSHIWLKLMG